MVNIITVENALRSRQFLDENFFRIAAGSIISLDERIAFSKSEVKLRRLRRRRYDDKYDIRDKNLSTVLANSSNHSRARCHRKMQHVSNMFTVNFFFCPSKANTSRIKNTSLLVIEMSLNNAFNTGQITEVSDSTKRQRDNSGAHADQ